MSGPLGVLHNPASTANRLGRALAMPDGALVAAPESPEALAAALAEWRAAGVETIAVDGGDGTVRELLSRLPEAFDDPPAVALLPRGNTNLFARVIGGWPGPNALRDLVAGGTERHQPVLRVSGLAAGPARGLMFGLGAYTKATALASGRAARGALQVGVAVAGGLLRLLLVPSMRQGPAVALEMDGQSAPEGDRLLTVVTTAPGRLLPGIEPFWGEGTGPLRWLDVVSPGRWLAVAAPFALVGRPRRWMAGAGYRSGRASALTLRTRAPVVLDGEVFVPDEPGVLHIEAEHWPRFLVPSGCST